MILLRDVLDFIITLGIADKENCYCGKMADKKHKAIGVYSLKNGHQPKRALGGDGNRSYEVKGISLLLHWNKSPSETEATAIKLQQALQKSENVTSNGHEIKFIQLSFEEPVPVGTDENGIYEFIIECLFYFRKEV